MPKIQRRIEAEVEYVSGRIQEAIQKGLPEVGWEGDPLLTIALDRKTDEWVIRDHAFSPPQVIIRKPTDGLRDLDFRSLCIKLREAQFKGQGMQTIFNRMEARNAAIEADRDKSVKAYYDEAAERLAWAVARDLDL